MDSVRIPRDLHQQSRLHYRGDKMKCERTELTITHRCTLKCKLCGAYSPYYSPTPHWRGEELQSYVDKYFEVVDSVEKMTISGGEPFLHPDLPELVKYLNKYKDRIGLLEFITNGTLVPKIELIRKMHDFGKVKVIIDNYGPELSTKVPEVEKVFKQYNIFFETRKYYGEDAYYDGWLDMSNLKDRERSEEQTSEIYHKCIFSQKFQRYLLVDGKLYLCATARRCDSLGLLEDNSDCIDLMDETISVEQKRERIKLFFDREHFESCKFCDGFVDTYKRYKPAEQL